MVVVVALDREAHASGRSVDTLSRLARVDHVVVVASWASSRLVARLGRLLPGRHLALVATRLSDRATRQPVVVNAPAIRRLVEDGALVVCLAGGPGQDDTASLAPMLARRLGASALLRVDGEGQATQMSRWV